jgi:hypothetical protein
LCVLAASPAWGERLSARLEYRRGAAAGACPDGAQLRREVGEILGYDPFSDDAPLSIECAIDRRGDAYVAGIVVRDLLTGANGTRVIESDVDDCGELARSVELAIAMVIDPLFQPDAAPPAAPAAPPSEPTALAPVEPTRAAPEAIAARDRAARRSVYFHGGARAGTGVQPGMTLGGAWGFGVRWGWFSVDAGAGLTAETTRDAADGRIAAQRLWGEIVPCAHVGPIAGCAVASGGVITASGDFQVDGQAETPWIAAGVRALGEIAFTPQVALRAQVDLLLPVLRTTLTVSGEPVWRAPTVGAELGAVMVLYFR